MFDYKKKAGEYYNLIESSLPGYLPGKDCLQSAVVEAMSYSLLGGGKRLRGILTLAFYEQCGGNSMDAMPFACAIEMLHAYSLIHDDLPCMDDDDLRRGKPSCHIRFGEAMAVLAGDGLQTLAFETMLADRGVLSATRVLRAAGEVAHSVGAHGMLGGQVIDIQHEGVNIEFPLLEQLNGLKTGALIRCCARVGCILAGVDNTLITRADIYAAKVGLAFQITDDILDITSTAQVLGKPIASDAKRDKETYATILGVEKARQTAKALAAEAKEALLGTSLDSPFFEGYADSLVLRDH